MNISSLTSLYPYQSLYSSTSSIQSGQPDTDTSVNATSQGVAESSRKNDFKSLLQDVKSGDLSAAQQDLAALQGNSTNTQIFVAGSSPSVSNNQSQQDFVSMVQDIKSGNITGAQNDLSALQKDRGAQVAQNGSISTAGQIQHVPHRHHAHKSDDGSNGTTTSNVNALLQMLSAASLNTVNTDLGNSNSSSMGNSAQGQNSQADSYNIAAVSAYQQQSGNLSNTPTTNFSIAA